MNDLNWIHEIPGGPSAFDAGFQTDWTIVRLAGQPSEGGTGALETLCRTYWYPLYAYVRRRGHGPEDAQDLTQEFFACLLTTPWLQDLDPARGRFRSFLLASMNNFLANQWRRGQAQKRGAGQPAFSLDSIEAEDRYRLEPSHQESPDKLYEREWSRTVFQRAVNQLRHEFAASGKSNLFEELAWVLDGAGKRRTYAEAAERLGMTEAAVKKTVQRLRERFHEMLHSEVLRYCGRPE